MHVTEEGKFIWTNDLHPPKADGPNDVTEDGISNNTCSSDSQSLNAPSSIKVTEDGIITFLIEKQFWKAQQPIKVTDDGIVNFVIKEQS